ncbi:MAG: fasciclin domain-containing protein [Pyrinomonadaceae bacterium]|nr:fasciclin domain-containing protein [Pyrinomonadaceae bacterium]
MTRIPAFAIAFFATTIFFTSADAQECNTARHSTQRANYIRHASFTHNADIVDTAVAAGDFTTLVAAVKAAGLVETLKGDGPFTVFAPTDAAFAKIPKETLQSLLLPENRDKLTKILTYHVVPGKVRAQDVTRLRHAKTVQGGNLQIRAMQGRVRINNANVVKTDIETSNGIIHVIDTVLMPR